MMASAAHSEWARDQRRYEPIHMCARQPRGSAAGGGSARYPRREMLEASVHSVLDRVRRAKLREIDAHRRALAAHERAAAFFEDEGLRRKLQW